jgi:putative transposase
MMDSKNPSCICKSMAKIESGAHTRFYIRYHFVWIVKYRKDLLYRPELGKTVKEALTGIAERYEFWLDTIGTDGNHIHVFVGAYPRYAPSRIAEIMKSFSAKQIFANHREVKKELWGGEFWGDGYYVGTVGHEVTEGIVRRYIENQGKLTGHKKFEAVQLSLF